MDVCVNGWIDGGMGEKKAGWVDDRVGGWMNGCIGVSWMGDEYICGWMNVWMILVMPVWS